ncbi:hypothetical protein [Carboxylicivirga sp. RSCT41]|uniref:hypothetical protein n=1 Tax=Carboxylicivirga agarovorans TaxID=3417570 RepID=UPI003D359A67
MKAFQLYTFVFLSVVMVLSCSKDDSDKQPVPDNKALIVNGTAYELSQATITYEGLDPLNEGHQYELTIVSASFDMERGTGTGEGLGLTIITAGKEIVEGTYTFDGDPARTLNSFSAYVVVDFNIETWERKHFFVVTSGTVNITQDGIHNYTVNMSVKADDIDDDDNIITSNNTITVNYSGTFTYEEYDE